MRSLIILVVLILVYSCEGTDFKNFEPAEIKINRVEIQPPNSPKESVHAVTDLWVYLNDTYLGTFPYPVRIPVLDGVDNAQIKIFPGIREFGIRSKPEIYSVLDPVNIIGNLKPGLTLIIDPVFNYKQSTKILFLEDFENGNLISVDLDADKANHLSRSPSSAFQGSFSGVINNTLDHPITEVGSSVLRIPASAYLELSFQAGHDFNVGLNIISGSTQNKNYFLALKASNAWKRVYIPFREIIGSNPDLTYQLIFKSEYQSVPGQSPMVQTVYLDYIKIISLP